MTPMKSSLLVILLCLCSVKCRNVSSDQAGDPAEQLEGLISSARKFMTRAVKSLLPLLLEETSRNESLVSVKCQNSLFKFLIAFSKLKPWAVYMVDAWAKSFDGILLGTVSSFGNYDECIAVEATETKGKKGPSKKLFDGQYCTIEFIPFLPPKPRFYSINKRIDAFEKFENDTELIGELTNYIQLFYLLPFRLGICVPSTCSKQDVYSIAKSVSNRIAESNITVPRCEVKNKITIESYQVPSICVFSCFFALVVSGTLLDIFHVSSHPKNAKKRPSYSLPVRILLCFSAYSNTKKLVDVTTGAQELRVLHGIKFYCMSWIILGHTYYHINYNMLRNLKLTLSYFEDFAFNSITNATLVVDNFFFISGLLTCFVSQQLARNSGDNFKPWQFILHRIYRFWPMMMVFVGLTMFLPWCGDGPIWHENIDPLVEACKKDWWTNAIFINNFYRSGPIGCVSHGWYLAADIQMYFICLFVIVPLAKYPRLALTINFSLLCASVLVSGLYNYFKEYPPTMLFSKPDKEQTLELMREIYYTPYHHIGSFCLGIFIAHFLQTDLRTRKIPKVVQVILWLLTLLVTSSTIFGTHSWNARTDPGLVASSLYAAFSRIGWVAGLAWIVWACVTGYGGILNSLLCWKALIPLSRLTFSVYLIHPYIQRVFYANIRGIIEARNYMAIFIWFGFLVVSFLIGYLVCLCFEAPFLNLGAIIFEKHKDWKYRRSEKRLSKKASSIAADNGMPKTESSESVLTNGLSNDGFISHL